MNPVLVQCPSCDAQLKIKNAALLGKKAPCPKCGEKFILQPLVAETDDEFDFGAVDTDDYGADELPPEDDFEQPPRRANGGKSGQRKGSSKGKKRRKAVGWQRPAMIGGGVLAGLLIVCGIVYGVMNLLGRASAGSAPDMAWLPDDTQMLVQLRVADVLESAPLQKLKSNPNVAAALAAATTQTSVPLEDIERISIGLVDDPGFLKQDQSGVKHFGGVMVLKKATDPEAGRASILEKSGGTATSEDFGGRQLTFVDAPDGRFGSCFIDNKTIAFGTEEELRAAVTANGACAAASRFQWVNSGADLVIAVVLKEGSATPSRLLSSGPGQGARGFAATLDFGSALATSITVREMDAADAKASAEKMKGDLAEAKENFAKARSQEASAAPPMMMMLGASGQNLMAHVEEGLQSAKVTTRGEFVQLTLKFPSEIIDDAQLLVGMAAGISGMGAGPPGGFISPSQPPGYPPGYSPGMRPPGPGGPPGFQAGQIP